MAAAHRRLAARWHPDRHVDAPPAQRAHALARMVEVNAAYEELRRPRLRPLSRPETPAQPTPARWAATTPRSEPMAASAPTGPPGQRADVRVPRVVVALFVGIAALAAVMVLAGALTSGSGRSDGAAVTAAANHLADAWRRRDHGAVYDTTVAAFQDLVQRTTFVQHFDACPRPSAPAEAVGVRSAGNGLWEADVRALNGAVDTTRWRRENGTWRWVVDDPRLLAFVLEPLASARASAYCTGAG